VRHSCRLLCAQDHRWICLGETTSSSRRWIVAAMGFTLGDCHRTATSVVLGRPLSVPRGSSWCAAGATEGDAMAPVIPCLGPRKTTRRWASLATLGYGPSRPRPRGQTRRDVSQGSYAPLASHRYVRFAHSDPDRPALGDLRRPRADGRCPSPTISPSRSADLRSESATRFVSVFTEYPPICAACSPHSYRPCRHACQMADFLVAVGIIGFTSVMLGLIWALDRV
jgi:hypothetical protein